jgi:hypothetical protein
MEVGEARAIARRQAAACWRAMKVSAPEKSDWYGQALLREVVGRYWAASGAAARCNIVNGPPGYRLHAGNRWTAAGLPDGNGWNAASFPDGRLVFFFDLLNASWAVAAGAARHQIDPAFDLAAHHAAIAARLATNNETMPAADPYRRLEPATAAVFRDMTAFVVAHELVHYTHEHAVAQILERARLYPGFPRRAYRPTPAAEARLAQLAREQEAEADLHGVDLMARTWAFDPRGALLALAFMQELARRAGRQPTPYDSHPPAAERFAKVQQHLTTLGYDARLA